MRDPTVIEQGFREGFGGALGATSFTCESAVSLTVPAGFRLEVYQIIFSNTGDVTVSGGYGGG